MTLGEVIKKYREENNLSLREFADKCGLSHAYIAKLEEGKDPRSGKNIEPTLDTAKRISEAINIPLDELLTMIGYIELDTPTPADNTPEAYIPEDYAKKYKVTKRDINQYEEAIKHVEAFFMDDKYDPEDKEKLFRDISELFWEAKEMNKKKYGRKKKKEEN